MKALLSDIVKSIFTLCSESVICILALVWYLDAFAIEALITLIGAASALIFSLVFRKVDKHKQARVNLNNSRDNIVIQDNRGEIRINRSQHHGAD